MPTNAYRETILEAVKTKLSGIVTDTSKTWSATVAPKVTRTRQNALSGASYPLVYLAAKDETYELRNTTSNFRQYVRTMRITIEYYMEGWSIDTYASSAVHDVERAFEDWTLGGVVDDCYLESNRALQAETDTVPFGGVEFVLVVRYRTLNNSPSARA